MRTAVAVDSVGVLTRRIGTVYTSRRGSPSSTQALVDGKKVNAYTIDKHKRFWQVIDPQGRLVCLTVYKRGAKEVVRRLDS